jgi:Flp pilus assembly protein TadG
MIRLLKSTDATAAVEAAIFAPIFLLLTIGITDVGSGMFVRMHTNAVAQAGATYAVVNCTSANWTTCQSSVYMAMDDAAGNASFCTGVTCSANFTACADPNGGTCFTVTANYQYSPILPSVLYSWAQSASYSSTVTVRVQ